MRWIRNIAQVAALIVLTTLFPHWMSGQGLLEDKKVEATLIAPTKSIQPDHPFQLGLKLKHAPNWHTYWKNPGDSGMITRIELTLPEGFKTSKFRWPTPKVYVQSDLVNYVYEKETLLIFEVTPSPNWTANQPLKITGKAWWLECDDSQCVPGSGDLSLTLPVTNSPPSPSQWKGLFEETLANLPAKPDPAWKFNAFRDGDTRYLTIEAPASSTLPAADSIYFFSTDGQLITRTQESITPFGENGYLITFAFDEFAEIDGPTLPGILVGEPGWAIDSGSVAQALEINPTILDRNPNSTAGEVTSAGSQTNQTEAETQSLALVLGFALLGGLILNLMPCVFPVLGIKILGFVQQAGEDRKKVVLHGVIFTLGVLISFWILSGALLLLRQSGEELGWGFQLQSANFVIALIILLLVFALNLSGVFEAGLSLIGAGSQLSAKQGLIGTFFSGVLATVVATPCAAPFLAPALGASLTLPPMQSLLVFTMIGIGLSLPYLTLSVFPGMMKLLPRPGAWMETFKQLMAFPLYATVAYLLWNVSGLVGEEHFLNILFGLVTISLGLWAYGRYATQSASSGSRWAAIALLVLCAGFGFYLNFKQPRVLGWEKWSPEKVAELKSEGRPFYIDFTARWCATCQVNKRVVFSSEEVLAQFKKHDVAMLKADWTNQDESITKALAGYGRSAVPFNLIYGPAVESPQILPEVLTPGIVLDELQRVLGK